MMERLTLPHYGGGGHYMKCSESFGCDGNCGECDELDKIVDRLAYYEDTEEQGRLHITPCKVGDTVYSKDGKAAEIEGFYLEKRSVAAQVSFVCDYDCEYCAFDSWHAEYSGENSCDGEYGTAIISVDDFGKTVFLTREEAENALATDKNVGSKNGGAN